DLEGAVKAHRRATELAPRDAGYHSNLGNALGARGDPEGAVRAYRKAIELDPKNHAAQAMLGQTLCDQGHFAAGRPAFRRCLELLGPGHPLRAPMSRQLQRCERLLDLDRRLEALRQGKSEPTDAAERRELA